MPQETRTYYGPTGELIRQDIVDIPDRPADPLETLQAQVDALTDIVLSGGAA